MYGEELIGKRFGRLVVTGTSPRRNGYHAFVWCQCDCGRRKEVEFSKLKNGETTSCGCFRYKVALTNFKKGGQPKHGLYNSPEYNSWENMKTRCTNPNNNRFDYYGGRGITVCPEWMESFEAFYAHIGPRPEPKGLYSIDRINNDGNYEPGNVRWATKTQQANNKSRNVICGGVV